MEGEGTGEREIGGVGEAVAGGRAAGKRREQGTFAGLSSGSGVRDQGGLGASGGEQVGEGQLKRKEEGKYNEREGEKGRKSKCMQK